MRKVIFLTPHFLPQIGGVEKHVAAVAKVLAQRDWEVEVVTVQENSEQELQEKLPYCHVARIPLANQKSKMAMWQWQKKYFKQVSKETIIHIHDVGWWVLPQLFFKNKNNFYITFHGWEGKYPVRWQAKLHRWLVSKLVNKTIHVGDFIQKFYWDKPTKVVYGGVDLPVQTSIAEPTLPALNIVFLGRLEKENAIDSYLELLTELVQQKLKVEMTWIGDGRYKSLCEKWGKVTGMVKDVRKYLSSADLVFASSYLSILEAQAMGKIVCSLYDNKLKKVYLESFPGKEGLLISNKPEQLATEIVQLTQHPQKFMQVSKKNAVFGQSKSWNALADVYEELWGVS